MHYLVSETSSNVTCIYFWAPDSSWTSELKVSFENVLWAAVTESVLAHVHKYDHFYVFLFFPVFLNCQFASPNLPIQKLNMWFKA